MRGATKMWLVVIAALAGLAGCDDGGDPQPTDTSDAVMDTADAATPDGDSTEDEFECAADSECGGRGIICNGGFCEVQACEDNGDCRSGRTCHEGSCTAEECFDDVMCGEGELCIDFLCEPNVCATSDDCRGSLVCDGGTCVQRFDGDPCTTDADCGVLGPLRCHNPAGTCSPLCESDADCTTDGETCDVFNGACRAM